MPVKQKKKIKSKDIQTHNNVTVMDYSGSHFEEKKIKNIEECIKYRDTDTVTWVNIDNTPPINFLDKLKEAFNLHPVVVDNILSINQRPKLEILNDYIYLSLQMLSYDEGKKKILNEQISIIIEKKFVITFQQGVRGDVFDSLRDRIRNEGNRIRNLGTDYLGYALLDEIVDEYFKVLEVYGEKIELLGEEVMTKPSTLSLQKIDDMKRKMINLRKIVWPLREVVSNLDRGETSLIQKGTRIYLRDIYDHVVQAMDSIETFRDILATTMDIYLSSISNRTNSVVKILTIITTIFMPLSFLAGFYGMNFKYLPLLNSPSGVILMTILMLSVFATMLMFFRKKGWM